MYTGKLIADLFEAVERAEQAAANPFAPPEKLRDTLVGVEADSPPYGKDELKPK